MEIKCKKCREEYITQIGSITDKNIVRDRKCIKCGAFLKIGGQDGKDKK